MILYFIKRIVPAALLVELIVFSAPQSAEAMTIQGRLVILKTYFQERSMLFSGFRAPLLLPVVYAENSEEERDVDDYVQEYNARTAAIDRYMRDRSMPLAGYGALMVAQADEYDIDWRLLPAIAIRESSGGKFSCGNNPFGWASCRIDFKSIEEAIDIVAWNFGGHNPNTAAYYKGDTPEKLQSYNGTVIPRYPTEVMRIMERIEAELAFL